MENFVWHYSDSCRKDGSTGQGTVRQIQHSYIPTYERAVSFCNPTVFGKNLF